MTDPHVYVVIGAVMVVTGLVLIGGMAWVTRATEDSERARTAVPGSTEQREAARRAAQRDWRWWL